MGATIRHGVDAGEGHEGGGEEDILDAHLGDCRVFFERYMEVWSVVRRWILL